MANTVYMSKIGLTGGAVKDLDSIDGAGLVDGDAAFVNVSNVQYIYRLDADSAAVEASPNIIAPDTNAGDKRWILQSYYSGSGTLYTDHIAESTAAHGVEIDGLTIKDSGFALGSDADGDMYYRASGALVRLPKGTKYQSTRMNSGATAPEWGNTLCAGAYELTDDATIAIDWDNNATQYVTLGATGRTITFANPVNGQVYRLIIIQDGDGARTITTWPTVKWLGGAAPTLSTTAASIDIVTLLYVGTTYYGDCAFAFAAPA